MPLPDPRAYFSDEEIDRARRYHRPGYVRAVAGAVVSLGYLAVLAFTGLGDAVADRMGSAAAFVAVIVVAGSLLGLPLRAWGFAHERRWGFATQSWLGWLNDWAKGAIVGLVVTGGLLLGFLTLAHALPHAWVWVAAPLAAAVVFLLWWLLWSTTVLYAIHAGGPGDPRVVPFVLVVAAVAGLVSDPFGMAVSRRWERAADWFSIDLTGDPEGFAEMERNLSLANLSELAPLRLAYLFTFSHPAPAERIAAARTSRATAP